VTSARLSDLGHHLSSRDRARQLREQVLGSIGATAAGVVIDLSEVRSISDSFADEFFGIIARDLGEAEFGKKIRLVNVSGMVLRAINHAVQARLHPEAQTAPSVPGFELPEPPKILPHANY
jgi:anti-anti-sigma regulatory factor